MTLAATPELKGFRNNQTWRTPAAITSVQAVLCDASGWSNPPTLAQVVASKLTEENGYAAQDATPAADSVADGSNHKITFQNVTFTLSSGSKNYTGFAIIVSTAGGEVGALTEKYDTTRVLDSAGASHPFNGLTYLAA